MDNCGGHAITDEIKSALESINTEAKFLQKNATDLVQPADSFAIQNIKTAWCGRWDEQKLTMIEDRLWITIEKVSGKLAKPGKKLY